MGERARAIIDPDAIQLPAGSRLDRAALLDVAVRTNAAHAALGTELLGVGPRAASIRVPWRADLAWADGARWANAVMAAMLDHACSLAALVTLGDATRYGGTMGLRIEYVRAVRGPTALVAHGHGEPLAGAVLRVHGTVCAEDRPDDPVAIGHCTVVVVA